jgi:hypothetical protein
VRSPLLPNPTRLDAGCTCADAAALIDDDLEPTSLQLARNGETHDSSTDNGAAGGGRHEAIIVKRPLQGLLLWQWVEAAVHARRWAKKST